MNLSAVMTQLISLFLMMFAGFLVARAGILTPDFRKKLSAFTLNTAAPCIILSSVLESESTSGDMLLATGMGVFFYIVMILLAMLLVRLVRTPQAERPWDQLMLIFTNVGFMGIPVIQSVYGPDGVALLSMFILMFNLFYFSYGVMLISGGMKFNPRVLLNACIISALLGLFFGITGLRLPAAVESTLASIGSMNTPLAMMIIGSSMAHSDVREALRRPRLYRVNFLRMVIMPLLMLVVVRFLPIPSMLKGIAVLLAAMPVAGNCGMLADVYTPGDMTASHAVIVSTLMSGVTLPLLCALLTVAL